jgi:hypothetical protein
LELGFSWMRCPSTLLFLFFPLSIFCVQLSRLSSLVRFYYTLPSWHAFGTAICIGSAVCLFSLRFASSARCSVVVELTALSNFWMDGTHTHEQIAGYQSSSGVWGGPSNIQLGLKMMLTFFSILVSFPFSFRAHAHGKR